MSVAANQEVEVKGWQRAVKKFGAYFEERGLGAADLPAAIIVHEIIGAMMALGAWALCYRVQPSRTVAVGLVKAAEKSHRLHQATAFYNHAMVQASNTVRKMSWLKKTNLDASRLTTSLAESLCLRAVAKPGTFVFKLWASYQVIRLGKQAVAEKKKTKAEPKKKKR